MDRVEVVVQELLRGSVGAGLENIGVRVNGLGTGGGVSMGWPIHNHNVIRGTGVEDHALHMTSKLMKA
jgi:hypothetical protein